MLKVNGILNFLQEDAEVTKVFDEEMELPPARNIPSPGQLDPDTHISVINMEDGTRLVGEDAPKNKDLVEWLKLHPMYTVDMPSYVPVSEYSPFIILPFYLYVTEFLRYFFKKNTLQ